MMTIDRKSAAEQGVSKRHLSRSTVSVEFVVPACIGATTADLVAEFAAWAPLPMDRQANGSFVVTLGLDPDRSWRYRFFIDEERWINGWTAGDSVAADCGQCWSVLHTGHRSAITASVVTTGRM